MKKKQVLSLTLLTLVLILAMILLAGCGGGEETEAPPINEGDTPPVDHVVTMPDDYESTDYCLECHIIEPYVESWESSSMLANSHQQAGINCVNCHERTEEITAQEIEKYNNGDYMDPLVSTQMPMEDCLQCHESYEALAERTADYTYEGEQVNPHDSHLGEQECSSCHTMHQESSGINYCLSCHHEGGLVSCYECHDHI
ncbi:MAG TPA: cytochrome c3 family protein [Oscillospiraceae bacterium]|nr:cytochrome c3 family protein [Oscillospiraceae bacterium]